MMVNKHSSGEGSDFLYWLLTLQCGNWEWFQKLGPCSLQEHQDANVLKRHLECLSQPQWAGCPVKWIEEWPIKPESVSLQQNQVTAINYNPTTLKFFFYQVKYPGKVKADWNPTRQLLTRDKRRCMPAIPSVFQL